MSKVVKNLITKELAQRLGGLEGVGVINPRGIDGIKTNGLRRRLHEKGLKMTVVKNSLARYITSVEGSPTYLSGLMTIVLGEVYLQYHMNRVRAFQSRRRERDLAPAQ